MLLLDANIPIYAFRRDMPQHAKARRWLERALAATEPIAIHELTELAFVRITTNPRAWKQPSKLDEALRFLGALRDCPAARLVQTGGEHRTIFEQLCRDHRLRGNDVTDAFIAAVAIESGAQLVSNDAGFARFEHLRWMDPLTDTRI